MKKLIALGVALLIASVFTYPNVSLQKAEHPPMYLMHDASPQAQVAPGHDHQAMIVNKSVIAVGQDDQDPGQQQPARPPGQGDQPGDTPTHRFSPGDGCSSVNPDAPNKERDGVNPNTVGCKCAKKCVNGQTQEDMSKDEKGVYICKNACHKDRCSCPDPCKN